MMTGARRSRPDERSVVSAVTVLLFLIGAPAGFAAIEGSPHDLIAQGYDIQKVSLLQERCNRCHIPSSSAYQGLLPEVPPVLSLTFGAASLGCFSCHDGTTIVSPDVDASRTAFHPASHGNNLEGYEDLRGETVGLPYLTGRRMECLTCHDPHDDGHRPFLRADLKALCFVCHASYAESGRGKENRTGNHILAEDPIGAPRVDTPLKIVPALRTAFPSAYPVENGKAAGSWHWDLGGHLGQGAFGGIVCSTCHAVHGTEEGVPAEKLEAIAPVGIVANLLCEGCHAGTRADGQPAPPHPNPGGTTTLRTYHVADDDRANGPDRLLEIREPTGWPFGGGTPRRLLCTTCHAPHGARVQTSLLRPTAAPGFCEECHQQVPPYHHVVGATPDSGCGAQLPASPYGPLKELSCASCHRAHNAGLGQPRESDYVPLLTAPALTGALCDTCHPAGNPTCRKNPEYRASHFLGDPTLPETYQRKDPPLRTEVWPESGQTSFYGGEKSQIVTCLSCHSFRKGAVTSGDAGTTRNLLARSGNGVVWEPGQESLYLCTGCHGDNPATGSKGHTHPLMSAAVAKLGRQIEPPVTTTPERVNCDSCHRPHEALSKGGYYILETIDSKNVDPQKIHPEIDFTSLCHSCHDQKSF